MKKSNGLILFCLCVLLNLTICFQDARAVPSDKPGSKAGAGALTVTRFIAYNGVMVQAVIDKPAGDEVDVLLAFHGTTMDDSEALKAAETMLKNTKKIIHRNGLMIVSVAYTEKGLLGDNIKECEAALLWTKNRAGEELGVKIKKVYLIGHSQGGYLVTRLNTMHATDGVIANGAGPIDLAFRCKLEESGKIQAKKEEGGVCARLKEAYGSVSRDPAAYTGRSLIAFSSGYKSKILFIQGMRDKKMQMALWPAFKEKVRRCTDCAEYQFLELEDSGHGAAFENERAIQAVNGFLSDEPRKDR